MHVADKPSKYSTEYLRKLFQYSLGEDISHAVTHVVGVGFGIYALINLTWVAGHYGNWLDVLSFVCYGLSILFMFTMSTIYHSMVNHTARSVFKRLDHISIYVMILGSYAPFVFSLLKTPRGYIIFAIMAVVTVCGILFKSFNSSGFKLVSTLLYVAMGWGAAWLLPQLLSKLPTLGVVFFLVGGGAYTLGAIFYAFARFKYAHMVWHLFVNLGAVFQFISIAFFILQH